jgi:hypothetical protein
MQISSSLTYVEHPEPLKALAQDIISGWSNGVWKFITGGLLTPLSTSLDDVVNTTVLSTERLHIIPNTLVSLPKFVKGDQGHGIYLNLM